MKRKSLLQTLPLTALLILVSGWLSADALAQDYGVGETVIVPAMPPDTSVVLDGIYEADIWDLGASFDLTAEKNFWSDDHPEPEDFAAWGRALFVEDTLYVFVTIEDDELFFHENGVAGNHILIGIDPVHEAGTTDQLVDQDDWAGWPENAPDMGPHAYTVQGGDNAGIKLWFGNENSPDPVAEGWARGEVWTDEENLEWGVEAAFFVPGVEPGAEVGFNIGGATGSQAAFDDLGEAFGFFSQWSVEFPGSDIQSRSASYGTLRMAGGEREGYGGGLVVQVPRVDVGSITIDGMDDEEAWADAQSDIDVTANWNAYGEVGEATPDADLAGETKLLWSQDTLYIHHRLLDPVLFFQEDDPWGSDMILVGIDNSLEGDTLFGPHFDGGVENAPEGVYTYFINPIEGLTIGWNPAPQDSGWANGVVYTDEDTGEWGMEAALYMPAIEMDAQIGFDIGGAQANQDQCDAEGHCDYAYFAWQTGKEDTDPGAINRDATYWATLTMVEEITTAIEQVGEVPERFVLRQNYPNPFNPSTTIEFATTRSGHVQLDIFNVLGQRVASLVDEQRPTGTYRVTWAADDLSSGVYVYQLRVDSELVGSRKMILLK